MMSTASTQYVHLAPNPKSSYRQLFVNGTRIRARTLYGKAMCDEPMNPQEIAEDYGVPVEAVREAIAYCESNPPELLEDYAREQALLEATGMNDPGYKYHGKPRLLSAQEWAKINR
jgi:uncharacterized protein (DUF433 family)